MTDAFDWTQTDARIEMLILVPAAISQGEEALPEVFSEHFCEGLPTRADAPLYAQLPALARWADAEETPEAWEIVEALAIARVNGFLVQAAQPVVRNFYPSGHSYSWGHYHTEWLYADSAEAIASVVDAWSKATLAKDRAAAEARAA